MANNSFKRTKYRCAALCRLTPTLGAMNTYRHYEDSGQPISLLMQGWARYWSKVPEAKEEYSWAFAELLDLVSDSPEKGWECILYALQSPECQPHLGVLAAGPLEDLLCLHGQAFIERVESLATSNPKFSHVLFFFLV